MSADTRLLEELTVNVCTDPTSTDAMEACAVALEPFDDPRAAYMRAQIALRNAEKDAEARRPLLRQLRSLYPADHASWLRRFEHAGVFEDNLTGLSTAWWGQELPGRQREGTYTRYSASELLALPSTALDPGFSWLSETPVVPGDPASPCKSAPWLKLLSSLEAQGFAILESLRALMTNELLQTAIPSCTANYFISADPSDEEIDEARLDDIEDGVAFLPFYSDQQGCIRWGAWLARNGERYCPVISAYPAWGNDDDDGAPSARYVDFEFAAPTLQSFVYRTWIENRIWYATVYAETRRPLLDFEEEYLRR